MKLQQGKRYSFQHPRYEICFLVQEQTDPGDKSWHLSSQFFRLSSIEPALAALCEYESRRIRTGLDRDTQVFAPRDTTDFNPDRAHG